MRRPPRHLLAGLLVVGGAAHAVVPHVYDRLVPRALGDARPWVYASGVAEVAAGTLLAVPRTRRLGGALSALVLVAIFPGNVQHALDGGGALWLRLPLQAPLVWWALAEALRSDGRDDPPAQDGDDHRASNWANSSAGAPGTV